MSVLHANAVDYKMKIERIWYLNALLSLNQKILIYSQFKNKVIKCIGAQHWEEFINNTDSLVKLILDCSRCSIIQENPACRAILNTRADLIYRLHVTRINKLSME